MRQKIVTRSQYTVGGAWGGVMLLVSPIVAALFSGVVSDEMRSPLLVFLAGLASILGLLLVLVGRRSMHEVVDQTEADYGAFFPEEQIRQRREATEAREAEALREHKEKLAARRTRDAIPPPPKDPR